ncbi:hypothetical protein FRC02_000678 [Tulasnella sp. 418]|nr:hypothetical protein FRC02_000678 [Tulasnella sp. 418]
MDAFHFASYAYEKAKHAPNSQEARGDSRRAPVATARRRELAPGSTPSTSSSTDQKSPSAALANPPDQPQTKGCSTSGSKTTFGSSEASASPSKSFTTTTSSSTSRNAVTRASAHRPPPPPPPHNHLSSSIAPRQHAQSPVVLRSAQGAYDPAVGRLHVPRGPAWGTATSEHPELHRVRSSRSRQSEE